MRLYYDRDADLGIIKSQTVGVIGYGNQGRAQALNLRDSGLNVIIGNRKDEYAERAREDGFSVQPIDAAVREAAVVLLLIPDEVMPPVFEAEILPGLDPGNTLVFASGYTIAFELLCPPDDIDVVLVAPRMIGEGVRELYLAGSGFPSFIGVAQDYTGDAFAVALALAKGIGSTRAGVVEVTFAQEAELDLFTEQCFGPAFGSVLTTAVGLLLDEGYPPPAVLLELYMSGELSYTLGKIAEMGVVEQSQLHSRTSQYGSMSRGMRFQLPGLRDRMLQGLEEIRSGQFAEEWAAEQAEGCPTLEMLKESARSLPLYDMERELRRALRYEHRFQPVRRSGAAKPASGKAADGLVGRVLSGLGRRGARGERDRDVHGEAEPLSKGDMARVLESFVKIAASDSSLQRFAEGRSVTTHYVLTDMDVQFYVGFQDGAVTGAVAEPPAPAEVQLTMEARVLDAVFMDQINPARAAMSGKITFDGDARRAMTVQRVQKDLSRLYQEARHRALKHQA